MTGYKNSFQLVINTELDHLSPPETIIHFPYKLLATICVMVGFTTLFVAWRKFKKAGTAFSPTAKSSLIVKDGIFRYTRNPMYLGMLLMLLGAAFAMGTLPATLGPAVFFLVSSFGDEYKKVHGGNQAQAVTEIKGRGSV